MPFVVNNLDVTGHPVSQWRAEALHYELWRSLQTRQMQRRDVSFHGIENHCCMNVCRHTATQPDGTSSCDVFHILVYSHQLLAVKTNL